jgi:hypothetical protein
MATFAILVRFDIPDDDVRDGGFDQAAAAEMVLRHGGMGTP